MLIGYPRVSTEDQAADGVSLAAQEERIRAYCLAQGHDVTIIGDEGVSGTTAPDSRPGLARALSMLRAGEAEGLVFLRLDRLTRSVRDLLALVDRCAREGWSLQSVTDKWDTSTPVGRFTLTILGAVAQLERDMISTRTAEALAHKRAQGCRLGAAPYGWRKVAGADGKLTALEPVEAEQTIIVRVRELLLLGSTQDRVADALNQAAVPSRSGRPWSRRGVQCILGQTEVA